MACILVDMSAPVRSVAAARPASTSVTSHQSNIHLKRKRNTETEVDHDGNHDASAHDEPRSTDSNTIMDNSAKMDLAHKRARQSDSAANNLEPSLGGSGISPEPYSAATHHRVQHFNATKQGAAARLSVDSDEDDDNTGVTMSPLLPHPTSSSASSQNSAAAMLDVEQTAVTSTAMSASTSDCPTAPGTAVGTTAAASLTNAVTGGPTQFGSRDLGSILSAMRMHQGDTSAMEQACVALCNLTAETDDIYVAFIRPGGLGVLVQTMYTHQADAGVMEAACIALHNVHAYFAEVDDNEDALSLIRLGGLEVLVQTMRAHATHTGVMEAASSALESLYVSYETDNADMTDAARRAEAAKDAGVEIVLQTMRRHQEQAGLMKVACGALKKLTNWDRFGTFNRVGGLEVLLQTMNTYHMNARVMTEACAILRDWALATDNFEKIASYAGVVKLLMQIIRTHNMDNCVKTAAFDTLESMTARSSSHATLVREGLLDFLLTEIRQEPGDHDIFFFKEACISLCRLALNPDNKEAFIRAQNEIGPRLLPS